jgi:hypothetical protein
MVNGRFPAAAIGKRESAMESAIGRRPDASLRAPARALWSPARFFVQILPHLRSFKFSENTSLIRIENGQKARVPANRAFKPAC